MENTEIPSSTPTPSMAEDEPQQLPEEGYEDTADSIQPTVEQPLGIEDVLQFGLSEVLPTPAAQAEDAPQATTEDAPQAESVEATADEATPTEQTDPTPAEEGGDATPASARKRKSRWGVAKTEEETAADAKPKRKSRFQLGPPENPNNAPLANSTLATLDPHVALRQEMLTVQTRLRELQAFAQNPSTFSAKGFDGPSPDPIYDNNGKRVNTRESRVKDFIKKEQHELVARAIELQGKITGVPVLPTTIRTRREIRIPIPFETYPDYNFKGVLIGARGLNQKRLEKETNCMIAVRGKGMRKKLEGVDSPEDNMEVHVLVAAYDQEDLDKGVARVKELLVPVSLEERQKQLRELDLLNGTVRPEQLCHGCGESGHKLYNCPKRFENRSWKPANIVCTICGDVTHAYIDCPSNRPGVTHSFAQRLNSEYDSFMAELTGEKPPEKKDEAATGVVPPAVPGQLPLGARPPFPHPNAMGPRPGNPMMPRFHPFNPLGMPRPGMPPLGGGAFNPLIQGNPFLGKFGPMRPDLRPGMHGLPPPVSFRPGMPPQAIPQPPGPGQPLLGFPDQGQVNGQANGQVNGQVNGQANGQANGQVNGQAATGQAAGGQAPNSQPTFPPGLPAFGNFPGHAAQQSFPGAHPSPQQYPPVSTQTPTAYPPQPQAAYPPQTQAAYPPQSTPGSYPPQSTPQASYPPQTPQASYLPQGSYPPPTSQYPPQASYPPQGVYPPPSSQYPPPKAAYPPTGNYPGQPLLPTRPDPNTPPWLIGQPAPQYPPAAQAPWLSSNPPYYANPYGPPATPSTTAPY